MRNVVTFSILALIASVFYFFAKDREGPIKYQAAPAIEQTRQVNVYSSRREDLMEEVFAEFTRSTGIKIRTVTDDAAKLITRLENEGSSSEGDLFITADAINLILAKKSGLLQPIESKVLSESIPLSLRDSQGFWFGLTTRARVIVYAKKRVNYDDVKSYANLADEKFKGKILVRSSNSPYNQALLSSIIAVEGEAKARKWVKGIVQNLARKPVGGDIDQIKAILDNQGDVAIVNSYYVARILSSPDEEGQRAREELGVVFPNQDIGGTFINISGAGVLKGAPNKENAVRLLEFLVDKSAQQIYAMKNQEYPVVQGVRVSETLEKWGKFKSNPLPLVDLEKYLTQALRIADEEGWA